MTTPRAIVRPSKPSRQVDPPTVMGRTLVASGATRSIAAGTTGTDPALLAPLPGDVSLLTLQQLYRQRQIAIAMATTRAISALWARHMRPERMADSWGALRDTVLRLIQQYWDAAAADSASFYRNMRVLSGFPSTRVPMVELPREELIKVADSQAMGTFFHNIKTMPEPEAADSAGQALEAGGSRLVLKGGRQTISEAAAQDPVARRWERVISPGACHFCSMLASRGAVYLTERTGQFLAHDHCHCTAQPVFRGQIASIQNRDLAKQWQQITKGKSGDSARKAWQEYWEANNGGRNSGAAPEAQEGGPGNDQRLGRPELSNQAENRIGQPS